MACSTVVCEKDKIPESSVEDMEGFKRFEDGDKCYTMMDGIKNLWLALKDIGVKLGLLIDAQEKKGFASAVLHFRIASRSYSNGALISNVLSRVPLNYKVTGFGVSVIEFPNSSGDYPTDDTITARLYDFTGNNNIGNLLTLNKTQLHDKHTNDGLVIGPNIGSGHAVGVKIAYANTDAGAFTGPDIDVYIHIEPTELITDV